MKRKGFTLIELLAVIVILAIIALIAVPIVMNIIANAQKSAFKDSAYGIIKAGEMYYTNKMMDPDGITEDKEFTFPDAIGLEIKGSKPTSGTMIITKEGKVGVAISNGKYCVKKSYNNDDVTIDENLTDCTIPKSLNPNIISENNCIKDTNVTCSNGTVVTVKVNTDTSYSFYVIKDTGSELTLIMDRNLGDNVVWINQADYVLAGGTSSDYGDNGSKKGPLTSLNYLETQTSNWTNIPPISYTLNNDEGAIYNSIARTNVRARMLTKTEATNFGCVGTGGVCPNYLEGTQQSNRYWLSTASGYAFAYVYDSYSIDEFNVNESGFGVRPVIKLSKTN